MGKNLFLLSFLIFLISCYNENKPLAEEPDPLFSKNEMVDIMTDVQLAEGIIALQRKENKKKGDDYNDSLFQVVFDHHGITHEQLIENIDFYNLQPKVMEKIMEKVLTKLSMQQTEIELKAAELDTIKKAEQEKINNEKEAEID